MSPTRERFWTVAGPVIAALLMTTVGAVGFLVDRRMSRIEDDVKYLIQLHMTPTQIHEALYAAR